MGTASSPLTLHPVLLISDAHSITPGSIRKWFSSITICGSHASLPFISSFQGQRVDRRLYEEWPSPRSLMAEVIGRVGGGGVFQASHSLRHCGEKWHILIDSWSVNLPHLTVHAFTILYRKWVLMNCSGMWDVNCSFSERLKSFYMQTRTVMS